MSAMKILICDDDTLLAIGLARRLQDLGHTICGTAATPTGSLEVLYLAPPDLVFVGRNFGGDQAGNVLVEALTRLGVPSIVISAPTQDGPLTTSAKAVLNKPIDDQALADVLAVVEQERRSAAAVDPLSGALTSLEFSARTVRRARGR